MPEKQFAAFQSAADNTDRGWKDRRPGKPSEATVGIKFTLQRGIANPVHELLRPALVPLSLDGSAILFYTKTTPIPPARLHYQVHSQLGSDLAPYSVSFRGCRQRERKAYGVGCNIRSFGNNWWCSGVRGVINNLINNLYQIPK